MPRGKMSSAFAKKGTRMTDPFVMKAIFSLVIIGLGFLLLYRHKCTRHTEIKKSVQ